MDESERKKEVEPVVQIVERRTHADRELSSAEVMKILRKRAAKAKKAAGETEVPVEVGEER